MNKKTSLLIVGVTLVLLLSACQALFGSPLPTELPRATNANPTRTLAPPATAVPTSRVTATPTTQPTRIITPSGPAECKIAPVLPLISEEVDKMIPDPSDSDWSYGPESAAITIYEYTDFQCQICANLALNLRDVQQLYPDDVRVIFRYLPLTKEHDKAALAAQAAEAAGLQDRYWEMHDLLFANQSDWRSLPVKDFEIWLESQAEELELNTAQFLDDLTSNVIVKKVFLATQTSAKTSLTNPPALFFNKVLYQDWVDVSSLSNMVLYYQLPERAYNSCPDLTIDPVRKYTATFNTEKGDIVFELYPNQAPLAVNSFVFLAREKWFDNTPFYRVVPNYLVQAGDPTGTGNGRPGYQFTNEVTPELRFDQPGMLALANYGEGTNGSQFFITYSAIPEFDGNYTIFGKVIEGMDVLESLRPRDPVYDQVLISPDILKSVTIVEE